jgi:hypothetical protein
VAAALGAGLLLQVVVILGATGDPRRASSLKVMAEAVSLVVYAVVLFVVPVWGRGTPILGMYTGSPLPPRCLVDWGTRFDVVPVILLGAAVSVPCRNLAP